MKSRHQWNVNKIYKKLSTEQLVDQIKSMTEKLDEPFLQAEVKLTRALEELKNRYNV